MPADQQNLNASDEDESTDNDEIEKVTTSSVVSSNLGNNSEDDEESVTTGEGVPREAPGPNEKEKISLSATFPVRPPEEKGMNGVNRPPLNPMSGAADEFLMGVPIENNPNDEAYHVANAQEMETPPSTPSSGRNVRNREMPSLEGFNENSSDAPIDGRAAPVGTLMENNPNDEMIPVGTSEVVKTPRDSQSNRSGPRLNDSPTPMHRRSQDEGRRKVSGDHKQLSSGAAAGGDGDSMSNRLGPQRSDGDDGEDDDGDDDENEEDDASEYRAEGYAGQKPEPMTNMAPEPTVLANLEYNPSEFATVNAAATREMQDLFNHILDYRPFVAELPTKLRPFIPDYIPAIGDLEPFVKIPRPDGNPDGLGLLVIDEPAIPQSNPAVVLLELRATNVHGSSTATVVDSFEDAANRPEVIDRWIADLKKVHYKKALPTVNYQKPMPDIENLMQVWPQAFEDVLNSDVPFPPPNIDLDMDQYVRTLCAVLDIPTYQSLIDSLHVMFTLYEDFRFNQHFQHE